MSTKKTVNKYLFYEFGYDLEQSSSMVTENWPFELKEIGVIELDEDRIIVFEFIADNKKYFALCGKQLAFYPNADMEVEDLKLQYKGSEWIANHCPINLATSSLGNDQVPAMSERRNTIEKLASEACESPRVVEGLYLRTTKSYLALIQDVSTGTGLIIGTGLEPFEVNLVQASPWRRLSVGIGKMLKLGILE